MSLDQLTPERIKQTSTKDIKKEMQLLQTDNEDVAYTVYTADVIAHAVGCTVFDEENVKKYRDAAQHYYDEAIKLEPENPHLWWKKAWHLSIIGGDGTEELKTALLNVIKYSKNEKYTNTDADVAVCKYVLKNEYDMLV